jgi:arsenate reductase
MSTPDLPAEFPIVIFHNPDCGTSRNVLEMIRGVGYAPEVVEYLKAGWTADQVRDLAARAGLRLRDLLREKETPAAELGLLGEVTDDELVAAMVAHPILVNRPIVVTPMGVGLCRPSETVFALLERKPTRFTKEDGEVVQL